MRVAVPPSLLLLGALAMFACGSVPGVDLCETDTCDDDVDVVGCESNPCAEGVACTAVSGSGGGFSCGACPDGLQGDGLTCNEIDGCASNPCDEGVTCTDVPAPGEGFTCGACPPGTEGDGISCVEIDGCASDPCAEGVACLDIASPGEGYSCGACPEGMEGDGVSCHDSDGCASNPCAEGVVCTDVAAPGEGFVCGACPDGSVGDGVVCEACEEGTWSDGDTCRSCFEEMSADARWSALSPMPTGRNSFGMDASDDGYVYAIGGRGPGYLSLFERYDVLTGTWSTLAPYPLAVSGAGAAWVGDGLYVIGGMPSGFAREASARVYDPQSGTWTGLPPMATARAEHLVIAVTGKIYVLGGRRSTDYTPSVEVFDPATSTWEEGASGAPQSTGLSGVAVGTDIYVFARNGKVRIYDTVAGAWSTSANDQPFSLHSRAAVEMDGLIYLMGGSDSNGYGVTRVDVYSPRCDAWTRGPSLSVARLDAGAAEVDGRIHVFGGYNPTNYLNQVEVLYRR